MTEQEVKHINETVEPEQPTQPVKHLIFTHFIDDEDGSLSTPRYGVGEWDQIRHLSGNLYAAWDDHEPMAVAVYIGKFVSIT